jgi:hypothetical protein
MKQNINAMKANFLNTVKNTVLFTAVALTTFVAQAQEGKVWTRINNFNTTGISTVNGQVVSNNPAIANMIADLNITSIAQALPAARTEGLKNVYEIACNCDENVLLQEVARLSTVFTNPELAPVYEVLNTPNDYYATFANDYALNLINAQIAWDVTTGDSSVVIAVCDQNFNLNHEELIGKYNYVTPNNMNPTTTHGTAVATTAAGRTNNFIGKSSIGYNSTLQLRAMNYNEVLAATYAGAKVINLSWSSGCFDNSYTQQIVDEVYNNNVVLIASAGNGNTCGAPGNLVYPAAHNHVISVTSVGPLNNHERTIGDATTTHQHNATVDIAAPGYDVALTVAPGYYLTGNGTSFAAPYVSGTVGLMLAANPCLTVDQVEYILKETAFGLDSINPSYAGGLGAGRLDAGAAVQMAASFATMQVTGTSSVNCETSSQTVELNIANGVAPYSVMWNTNDTTLVLEDLQDGATYTATVIDATGCIGTYQIIADTVTPVMYDAQINNVNCNAENSGSIELTITSGQGAFQYLWDNGATTSGIYNLGIGTYEVRIVDAHGCFTTADFDVNQPEALVATGAAVANITNSFASVDLEVIGGTAPYNYTWNNGSTSEDLNNVANGFYEVSVTDAHGCNTSFNIILNNNTIVITTAGSVLTSASPVSSQMTTGNTTALGITEATSTSNLTVYPNPATDVANVTWEGMEVTGIAVYNMAGQLVQNTTVGSFVSNYTVQGLATGDYLVHLTTAQGEKLVKKVTFL